MATYMTTYYYGSFHTQSHTLRAFHRTGTIIDSGSISGTRMGVPGVATPGMGNDHVAGGTDHVARGVGVAQAFEAARVAEEFAVGDRVQAATAEAATADAGLPVVDGLVDGHHHVRGGK